MPVRLDFKRGPAFDKFAGPRGGLPFPRHGPRRQNADVRVGIVVGNQLAAQVVEEGAQGTGNVDYQGEYVEPLPRWDAARSL